LSLSRQIIRMHGGELSVASLPYRETCFTVSLPVKP
jgi:signal transduction histidine kinase